MPLDENIFQSAIKKSKKLTKKNKFFPKGIIKKTNKKRGRPCKYYNGETDSYRRCYKNPAKCKRFAKTDWAGARRIRDGRCATKKDVLRNNIVLP